MKAWTFQYKSDVAKKGDAANWYTGWLDDGRRRAKSFGPGAKGKASAEKHAIRLQVQIEEGTYESKSRATWKAFRAKYDAEVIGNMTLRSAEAAKLALDTIEARMKPGKVSSINAARISKYVSDRLKEDGYGGRTISKATVNRELRYLRAMLRVAQDWGYLAKVPRFKFLKVDDKLPTFIDPDQFVKLYQACGVAKHPKAVKNVAAADWWRGLLMTAYLTGWRIRALLELKWADVNLDAGEAVSRAADNKGKRDQAIALHPTVIEHLRRLEGSFDSHVFPWNHSDRFLYTEFYKLQDAAEVKPDCKERFGFHDLRRGFATCQAANLDLFTLQKLMQHKSLETTKLYVNMANRLKPAVERLFVPDVTAKAAV